MPVQAHPPIVTAALTLEISRRLTELPAFSLPPASPSPSNREFQVSPKSYGSANIFFVPPLFSAECLADPSLDPTQRLIRTALMDDAQKAKLLSLEDAEAQIVLDESWKVSSLRFCGFGKGIH